MDEPKTKILVVDDEEPARRKLMLFLRRTLPDCELLESADGLEAVEMIDAQSPDLVFLDIQMARMTGLEVVDAIGADAMPPVVFVTAYDEFAVRAFDLQAVDYLLKPYDRTRFERALRRAMERVWEEEPGQKQIDRLMESPPATETPMERIVVKERGRVIFVPVSEVERIAADDKYLIVHASGKDHQVRATIKNFENRLDPQTFFRIHRSHIVNLNFVRELQPFSHGDYTVVMKDGAELTLSRRFSGRLLEAM